VNIKHTQRPDKLVHMGEDEIHEALIGMESDLNLKTGPSYKTDALHSTKRVSFQDTHKAYLKGHPKVNPKNYLANVRTMIKIRP